MAKFIEVQRTEPVYTAVQYTDDTDPKDIEKLLIQSADNLAPLSIHAVEVLKNKDVLIHVGSEKSNATYTLRPNHAAIFHPQAGQVRIISLGELANQYVQLSDTDANKLSEELSALTKTVESVKAALDELQSDKPKTTRQTKTKTTATTDEK